MSLENSTSSSNSKPIPLQFDLGLLFAIDINNDIDQYNPNQDRENFENQLLTLNRDNAQKLINEIFSLSKETTEDGLLISLPKSKLPLPRSKPLPKPKAKTTWEKFAEKKNIGKKKRPQLLYNEERREYLPRHGYKSAKNDPLNNWVEELN